MLLRDNFLLYKKTKKTVTSQNCIKNTCKFSWTVVLNRVNYKIFLFLYDSLLINRFIEEYKSQGVSIWGLTIQNEPNDGFIPDFSFQCMGMHADEQRDFIKLDLVR